jgi:regulatory protein
MPDMPRAAKLDPERLWNYALRLLGQRAYSAGELRAKLMSRSDSIGAAEQVMTKLADYGLLDDQKFAETYAVSRRENDQLGRLRVIRDLRARRVSHQVAERAVSRAFSGTDEQELAAAHLARKFRGKDMAEWLSDERHLANAFGRLQRAGFSTSASIAVLKRFAVGAVELENLPEMPPADDEAAE